MLFWMCKTAKQFPNEKQIEHVILRNFSGFPTDDGIDIIHLFKKELCDSSYPDKDECRRTCRSFLKDEFKKYMYNDVLKLLFQEFQVKQARKHKEHSTVYSTEEEFEDYQKLEFSHCYHKNDFEDSIINQKFEEMQEKYCKERFDNEVVTSIICIVLSNVLFSCGLSSSILIILREDWLSQVCLTKKEQCMGITLLKFKYLFNNNSPLGKAVIYSF